MAKIKITESELKQVISECVKAELLEAGGGGVAYGAGWSNLSPEEKKAAIERYSAWRSFDGSPISPERAEKIYNRKRDRKLRKAEKYNWDANKQIRRGLSVSQDFAAKQQQNMEAAQTATNNLANALSTANQELNNIVSSLNESKGLQENGVEQPSGTYYKKTTTGADGSTATTTGRSFTPDQITALTSQLNTNINNLKAKTEAMKAALDKANGTVKQLTKDKQTLTDQNKNLTAQAQAWQKKAQSPQIPATQPKPPTGQAIAQAPQGGLAPLKPNTARA